MKKLDKPYNIHTENPAHYLAVVKCLWALGFRPGDKMVDSPEKQAESWGKSYPEIIIYPDMTMGGNYRGQAVHFFLKLDDLAMQLSQESEITVKLNGEYNAVVTKDQIIVGCQKFPTAVLDELLAAREKLKAQNS